MSRRFQDDDGLLDPFGDELDLAETIARENPTADQLQHFANLRGAKHAMLNQEAPFIRNNPVSVLKGSLGIQAEIPVGGRKQVANWTGDDAETLPVTITLGQVVAYNPATATTPYINPLDVYGVVKWGTRSALLSAEIDIGTGCQLTIAASMVTVEVVVAQGNTVGSNDIIPRTFTGMISFHPIVRTQNVTRTLIVRSNAVVTQQTVFPIPSFSKTLNILKMGNQSATGDLGILDSGGNTIAAIPIAAGAFYNTINLPNEAFAVFFINSGTGLNVPSKLIFNLAI